MKMLVLLFLSMGLSAAHAQGVISQPATDAEIPGFPKIDAAQQARLDELRAHRDAVIFNDTLKALSAFGADNCYDEMVGIIRGDVDLRLSLDRHDFIRGNYPRGQVSHGTTEMTIEVNMFPEIPNEVPGTRSLVSCTDFDDERSATGTTRHIMVQADVDGLAVQPTVFEYWINWPIKIKFSKRVRKLQASRTIEGRSPEYTPRFGPDQEWVDPHWLQWRAHADDDRLNPGLPRPDRYTRD